MKVTGPALEYFGLARHLTSFAVDDSPGFGNRNWKGSLSLSLESRLLLFTNTNTQMWANWCCKVQGLG